MRQHTQRLYLHLCPVRGGLPIGYRPTERAWWKDKLGERGYMASLNAITMPAWFDPDSLRAFRGKLAKQTLMEAAPRRPLTLSDLEDKAQGISAVAAAHFRQIDSTVSEGRGGFKTTMRGARR